MDEEEAVEVGVINILAPFGCMTLPGTHYHFAAGEDAPRMNYGRRAKLEVGKTYATKSQPVPCERGLHASVRAIDALKYAQGNWVSRVTLGGIIVPHGGDKDCAQERTHLVFADATMVLHEFACWCAERALKAERKAGREPHPDSWAAIEVKRQWMKGEATDEQLTAARAAAMDAWSAAGAAWSAAWAARYAAMDAWYAAWAAGLAAMDAAWSAAEDAQNRKLEQMLSALLEAK